jgi:hypothetical protein
MFDLGLNNHSCSPKIRNAVTAAIPDEDGGIAAALHTDSDDSGRSAPA